MLDSKCKFILNYINDACKNGEFTVFTIDEIVSKAPISIPISLESATSCFRELYTGGYIRCKYDDGYSFCATITEKGVSSIKETSTAVKDKSNMQKSVLGWLFFLSFLGGFVGSVIAITIAFLVGV